MNKDEYFSVKAKIRLNVEVLPKNASLPSMDDFVNEIPQPFLITNQCCNLNVKYQKELANVVDMNPTIEKILHIQNEKIDLILGFLLAQDNQAEHDFHTHHFGASQLDFYAKQAFSIGALVRIKLFLPQPVAAIYCYGQVTSCQKINKKYDVQINFCLLQEQDRDVLIRSALYHQQLLLRKRAIARQH